MSWRKGNIETSSRPFVQVSSPVIYTYTLSALSTSSQVTLHFPQPHTFPCFFALSKNFYLPFPKMFSFQDSYIQMSFRMCSATAFPIYFTDLFKWTEVFSCVHIMIIPISWCACVCLFFRISLCVFNFQLRNKLWVWVNKSEDKILPIRIVNWSSIFFTLCQYFEIINKLILFIISFYLCLRLFGLQLLCFL